jgi:hypothetical protein
VRHDHRRNCIEVRHYQHRQFERAVVHETARNNDVSQERFPPRLAGRRLT